jgi:hypothetical protein
MRFDLVINDDRIIPFYSMENLLATARGLHAEGYAVYGIAQPEGTLPRYENGVCICGSSVFQVIGDQASNTVIDAP